MMSRANIVVLLLTVTIFAAMIPAHTVKMVRLCIASVDPIKLSSQCVMCSRREFPLTTIDCTGITKMNDLIANPLSVQEATCLIYNCRRQVPEIKPEPYHGSVSHAVRTNYPSAASQTSRTYGIMPSHGMFGGNLYGGSGPLSSLYPQQLGHHLHTPYNGNIPYGGRASTLQSDSMISQSAAPLSLAGSGMLTAGASASGVAPSAGDLLTGRQPPPQALPYAVVPAAYTTPFGTRKYKAALVPLF